jgi:Cu+-exporting ATPase
MKGSMEATLPRPEIKPENTDRSVIMTVSGMTCASCATRIERKLRQIPGVKKAAVNFASQKAYIQMNSVQPEIPALQGVIEKAGYGLTPYTSDRRAVEMYREEAMRLRWRLVLGGLLAAPLLLQHLLMPFMKFHLALWPQFLLSLPVYAVVGWPFHQAALKGLRRGEVTMDTLISLGSSTAFFASVPALFGVQVPLYFDAASLIIFFVSLGRYLEILTKRRANRAMEMMMDLKPRMAHVVKANSLEDMPVEMVAPGDILCVNPGETIPVDGEVIEGKGKVDESLMTGESMPVEKKVGHKVFAGTVNQHNSFTIAALAVGEGTALAGVIRLVEEAQGSKAPIQRNADTAAALFVPFVLVVAVLTVLGWMDIGGKAFNVGLSHAIAVLVIACPCALGLATPIALMVGIGVAAKRSILIRRAGVLESSSKIDTIVFDKTGTLTEGRPRLVDILVMDGLDEEKILRYAASLELRTNHPLASAVLREAMVLDLIIPKAERVVEVPGAGLTGMVEGHEVAIGTKAFIESMESIVSSAQVRANVEAYRQGGQTVSLMALEGKIAAILVMEDPPRANSKDVILDLKKMGIQVHLLTGDGEVVAQRLGHRVGVDIVKASMNPLEKVDYIKALQMHGKKVVMVGDGFNDAAALSTANLGIAMGGGADVTKEAGDMVLMQGDLSKVIEALRISRGTFQVIRQNLYWAFGYNLLAIPLAVLAQVPPSVAALSMSFSSIAVVLNALRLYRKKF